MKLPFDLIEKPVGAVTYEHCVVQKLYGDIYIGDAERNFYVEKRREVNLCVHFNRRVLGQYKFIPEYQYYITDGRCSLELHHNLGYLNKEDIIECFNSLEEARISKYYKDFCELKKMIDEEIERQKELEDVFYDSMYYSVRYDEKNCIRTAVYEMPLESEEGFVQYHVSVNEENGQEEWKMSKSDIPILDLWCYLKDFYEIDEAELHLLKYLPMNGNMLSETAEYYKYYKCVRKEVDDRNKVVFC